MNASAVSALNIPIGWPSEPAAAQKSGTAGDFEMLMAESIGLLTPVPLQPAAAWRIPDLSNLASLDSINSGPVQQDSPAPALPSVAFPAEQPTAQAPTGVEPAEPQIEAQQTPGPQAPVLPTRTAQGPESPLAAAQLPAPPPQKVELPTAKPVQHLSEPRKPAPHLNVSHVTAPHAAPLDAPVEQPDPLPDALVPDVTPAAAAMDDVPDQEIPSIEAEPATDFALPAPAPSNAHPSSKPATPLAVAPHASPRREAAKIPAPTHARNDAPPQMTAPVDLPTVTIPARPTKPLTVHHQQKKSEGPEHGVATQSQPAPVESEQNISRQTASQEVQGATAPPPMKTAVDLRIREKRSDNEPNSTTDSPRDEEAPTHPAPAFRLSSAPPLEAAGIEPKHSAIPEIPPAKPAAEPTALPPQYTTAAAVPATRPEPESKPEAPPLPPAAHTEPVLPQKEPATQPLRAFSLEFAPDGARDVRLHVSSHGSDVHVALRSNDEALSGRLRDGMHELVGNLSNAGYEADAWSPRDGGRKNQPEAAEEAPKPSRKQSNDLAGFEQMMQTQTKETL